MAQITLEIEEYQELTDRIKQLEESLQQYRDNQTFMDKEKEVIQKGKDLVSMICVDVSHQFITSFFKSLGIDSLRLKIGQREDWIEWDRLKDKWYDYPKVFNPFVTATVDGESVRSMFISIGLNDEIIEKTTKKKGIGKYDVELKSFFNN